MAQGIVKWFNETKGFGFIKPDVGTKDVFVHVSALNLANISVLMPDDRVEYEVKEGKKGQEAVKIRRV